MGAQALRWDFSSGIGADNAGGECLFGNDFEEVAASAAATSATASWLPPGASMRHPPDDDSASPSSSVLLTQSSMVHTVGDLPIRTNTEKGLAGSRSSKMSCSRSKPKGKRRLRSAKTPTADLVDMPKAVSKSPSWDPGQLFGAHYDDNISGAAGDGENSMQDMSLSLLNMSLDDETLDALGLTH